MRKKLPLLTLLLPLNLLLAVEPKPLTLASVDQRTVTVDAIAVAKAPPDRLEWFLEIRTTKATMKESRAVIDASLQRLLAALKGVGLTDDALSISDVDQGRDIEWTERKRIFKGFYSSLTLRLIITDLKLINRINSEILADDLIEVKSMAQRSDHEGELRQKALVDAAQVARKKALVLAETLGAKVGDVIRVSETSFETSERANSMIYAAPQAQSISRNGNYNEHTALITEISVRASVNVTFELVK